MEYFPIIITINSQILQQLQPTPIRKCVRKHPDPVHHPPEEYCQAQDPPARCQVPGPRPGHHNILIIHLKLDGAAEEPGLSDQDELDDAHHDVDKEAPGEVEPVSSKTSDEEREEKSSKFWSSF